MTKDKFLYLVAGFLLTVIFIFLSIFLGFPSIIVFLLFSFPIVGSLALGALMIGLILFFSWLYSKLFLKIGKTISIVSLSAIVIVLLIFNFYNPAIYNLAVHTKNGGFCNLVLGASKKNPVCGTIRIINLPPDCTYITKDYCNITMAGIMNDISYCDKLSTEKLTYNKASCYNALAFVNRDKSLCREGPGNFLKGCVDAIDRLASFAETNKISQITNWKTYKNDQYGFEISLPIDKIFNNPPEVRDFYKDISYKEIYITTLQAGCALYVYPNIDDKFLSEIKNASGLKNYELSILRNNDGRKYYIGYRSASSAVSINECTPVFDLILSTFKFTK